jgi:hypothetical protein
MRVAFVAPGLAASTHDCVRAAIARSGHEAADGVADVAVATWFGGKPPAEFPRDVPLVRWWVGSDVLALRDGRTRPHSRDERLHWAGSPGLARELASLGVPARVLPILPHWEPTPLPRSAEPVVLAYCRAGREALYRWADTCAIAARCPDVQFRVFRQAGEGLPPNLTCIQDWVAHDQMRGEYARARAVLRLVEHDGTSLSILEALTFGRHALWSYPYPCCREVHAADEAVATLRAVLDADINHDGVEHVRALRRETDARMGEFLEDAARAPKPQGRWGRLVAWLRGGQCCP